MGLSVATYTRVHRFAIQWLRFDLRLGKLQNGAVHQTTTTVQAGLCVPTLPQQPRPKKKPAEIQVQVCGGARPNYDVTIGARHDDV